MILATHAAIGSAAAEFTNNPGVALAIGFASHFVLDALPHWDYKLRSLNVNPEDGTKYDMPIGRDFAIDFVKMAFDALLGTAVGLLFYGVWLTPGDYTAVFFGAVGGLLPDVLQFAYIKLRCEPLIVIQRFHVWIHTKRRLDGRYIVGALLQISVALVPLAFILFL